MVAHATKQVALGALLQEGGLALQGLQRLLESGDLLLPALLALLVGLRLRDTLLGELGVVLHHRSQLRVDAVAVGRELGGVLGEGLGLLGLVGHVRVLGRGGELVLLGGLLVGGLGRLLLGDHVREALREVRLGHLEHADDVRPGAVRGLVLGVLGVVVAEDLQGHLDALDALLQLRAALLVLGLLLRADLVHLGLGLRDLRELLLEDGDLLLELRGQGARLVDLGRQLLDLVLLVLLLRAGLAHLLVAVRLLLRLLAGLREELGEHVRDHALDLREGVVARHGRRADGLVQLRGEEHQRAGPGVARQALDLVHRLQVGGHGAGVRLHLHLREGGRGVVGLGRGGAGHLLDHGLRRREGVELLAAGLRLLLEVGGLGHAVVVQVAEGLDVLPEVLLGDREVALVGGLGLAGLGLVLLGLVHVLLGVREPVLEGLLQHLEVVGPLLLGLPEVVELRLGLLEEALERLDDGAALLLVRLGVRGAQGLLLGAELRVLLLAVLQLARVVALQQGRELLRAVRGQGAGVDDGRQGLRQGGRVLDLHQGRAALHLALQDGDGALELVDGGHELLLLLAEGLRLGAADQGRRLEVGLVGGDGRGELLDLRGGRLDDVGLLLDGGLQVADLGLTDLDLVADLDRAVLAPLRELVVCLLGRSALREDLLLHLAQELQDLAHRVGLASVLIAARHGGRAGDEDEGEESRKCLHCLRGSVWGVRCSASVT
mmetsp:Transcript_53359/g.157142  ORF Transcript_53359/g.157142 Transcript_53359/m.157142 type:complete len:719 (+) Transcript_53359:132-2288(+)